MWIDDMVLEKSREDLALSLWQPEKTCVVLGSGNQEKYECHLEAITREGVPLYRRYGGGGTVVLHPGCFVISVGTWVKELYQNDCYFDLINQSLISTLAHRWPTLKNLYQDGISDIVFAGKKLVGSSMFRSRNYLLYQGSLLFETRISEINRYLSHPSKEPSYRAGKKHQDFLTSLKTLIPHMKITELSEQLHSQLEISLRKNLEGHLIAPIPSQIKNLEIRRKRGKEASPHPESPLLS